MFATDKQFLLKIFHTLEANLQTDKELLTTSRPIVLTKYELKPPANQRIIQLNKPVSSGFLGLAKSDSKFSKFGIKLDKTAYALNEMIDLDI